MRVCMRVCDVCYVFISGVRSKRRVFSPGAAARHSGYVCVRETVLISFPLFSFSFSIFFFLFFLFGREDFS